MDRKASGGDESEGARTHETLSSTPTPPPPGLEFPEELRTAVTEPEA